MVRSRSHRLTALVAAYALALQALVAAFTVPGGLALAAADPSVICRADAGGNPADPVAHDRCAACLAGHCASSFASGNSVATPLHWPTVATLVEPPRESHAAITLARSYQHPPRAPPLG